MRNIKKYAPEGYKTRINEYHYFYPSYGKITAGMYKSCCFYDTTNGNTTLKVYNYSDDCIDTYLTKKYMTDASRKILQYKKHILIVEQRQSHKNKKWLVEVHLHCLLPEPPSLQQLQDIYDIFTAYKYTD